MTMEKLLAKKKWTVEKMDDGKYIIHHLTGKSLPLDEASLMALLESST